MYNLDSQFNFNNEEGLYKFGHWLGRKVLLCNQKLVTAREALRSCGFSEEVLRQEWAAQVKAQTKPLPRKCPITCGVQQLMSPVQVNIGIVADLL